MRLPLSLRARLLITTCIVALVALLVADVTVYASLRSFLFQQLDQGLENSHLAIEQSPGRPLQNFGSPNAPAPLPRPGSGSANEGAFCNLAIERTPGVFVQVRMASNKVISTENCPAYGIGGTRLTPHLPQVITGYAAPSSNSGERVRYFTTPSTTSGGPTFRVLATQSPNGTVLIVATPMTSTDATLNQLLTIELIVTAAALLASFLLGWWLVWADLRPLREVERTAVAMSTGDFSERLQGFRPRTEVGEVAQAINVMADHIVAAFSERDLTESELRASEARLRQFVADASHELRTPIAAISAYAQLFERGAARDDEEVQRVISGIAQASTRMARLVEDLLLLARLDEHKERDAGPVELVGLAAEAIDTARTVGPGWSLELTASDPVVVRGDATALRQVLDNLLANVRAHTPQGTHTHVLVTQDSNQGVVEVRDDGPGFEAGSERHLFERFFRADTSRSRTTGGAGLGLAIVHSIITNHGGVVEAHSVHPHGAAFRISLPLTSDMTEHDLTMPTRS